MKGGYASLSGSGGLSKKEIKKIIEELLTE